MKRIIIAILIGAMILPTTVIKASSSETTITGNVVPTVLNVTTSATIAFSINPNNKEGARFSSSDIKITNNTNAPVDVKIAKGKSNFTLSSSSDWKPIDVSPTAYNWGSLGYNDSESYISYGIRVSTGEWRKVNRSSTLYVNEQNNSNVDISLGEIQNNAEALVTMDCNHGLSFRNGKEAIYKLIWTFSLSQ